MPQQPSEEPHGLSVRSQDQQRGWQQQGPVHVGNWHGAVSAPNEGGQNVLSSYADPIHPYFSHPTIDPIFHIRHRDLQVNLKESFVETEAH